MLTNPPVPYDLMAFSVIIYNFKLREGLFEALVAFDLNAGDTAFISLMAGQLKKLADYIRHLCQLDGSCTMAVRRGTGAVSW